MCRSLAEHDRAAGTRTLPRASEASCDPGKWSGWILAADRGHGSDWQAVFKLGVADADQLSELLSAVIANVPVSAIRDLGGGPGTRSC